MDAREKTWHGIRAASLSIIPGAGHLYLGEKRGYGLLAASVTLILISRLWWPPAEVFYLIMMIVSAGDAYGIGKRGHGLF